MKRTLYNSTIELLDTNFNEAYTFKLLSECPGLYSNPITVIQTERQNDSQILVEWIYISLITNGADCDKYDMALYESIFKRELSI